MNSTFNFLPANLNEAKKNGDNELDVIIVSADAYVDHPSFAGAIIGRFLESLGLKVGIISQPDWHSTHDFTLLNCPRLFFGVTAGNLDSMVSLYTAQRKIRSLDPYSENGIAGKRPYLPSIVYTNRIKEAYKNVPVILGGIEASLRRIAHYDFYTDKIRQSILLDAKADLLVYGNGEAPLKEIVKHLKNGMSISELKDIRGTVVPVKQSEKNVPEDVKYLPSYEKVKEDKSAFSEMTRIISSNLNPYNASRLFQETGTRGILINQPAFPLSTQELDAIYALPFTYRPHPGYRGSIPAFSVVKNSITSHRGCYGGCSFCSLYLHQGKIVQSRSIESIKKEVSILINDSILKKNKNIVITDIGGPTANMYGTDCGNDALQKKCRRISCLYPFICKNLNSSSGKYLVLLENIRKNKNIKAVYINSGIRYDLALLNDNFIDHLVKYYTPGQLSIAPEHSVQSVLNIMSKPDISVYEKFSKIFYDKSKKSGKKQFLLPYFIIGHPGSSEKTEKELKNYLQKNRIKIEQIQEFYPTPMTISTSIYYTGMNPITYEKIQSEKKLGMKKKWKNEILIKTIFIILIFLNAALYAENMDKKIKVADPLALKEYYDKYHAGKYPNWFKKILENKDISLTIINEKNPSEKNLKNLIKRAQKGSKFNSYENVVTRELYIMFFEGGQRYLKNHFSIMNQIESQAFLYLVISPDKKHEKIVGKQDDIGENITKMLMEGNYFFDKLSQIFDVISNEKFLLHAMTFKDNISKIANRLIMLIDPSDFRTYVQALRGGSRTLTGYRMEIYRQLENLAGLSIREASVFPGGEIMYTDYNIDNIQQDYKGIKDKLDSLIADEYFMQLSLGEQEKLKIIIDMELHEVKQFFNNLYPH